MDYSLKAICPHILLLSAPFFEHVMAKKNFPRHIGFIPDGNRRWAQDNGFPKEAGYAFGIEPGLKLFQACKALGIEEVSIYGFTRDNAKRPSPQLNAFRTACVEFAQRIASEGVALLVLGDDTTGVFPEALKPFRYRSGEGMKVNFLVNYGWDWDLEGLKEDRLRSHEISPMDLIVRWGGGRRLSGFLPAQSVYADFFVIEDYWPDYQPIQFEQALMWFREQDQTLGG